MSLSSFLYCFIYIKMNADFVANLQTNLASPLVATKLTPTEVSYINTLLQAESDVSGNSGIISQIQNEFNIIIKEGGIRLHDIPQLVLLITNILKTNIVQNTIQNVGILNIIKFLLDSFFDSNLLPLNEIELSLIKTLVDSSLQLLQTNIDFVVKEEQVVCSFFEKCKHDYFDYL